MRLPAGPAPVVCLYGWVVVPATYAHTLTPGSRESIADYMSEDCPEDGTAEGFCRNHYGLLSWHTCFLIDPCSKRALARCIARQRVQTRHQQRKPICIILGRWPNRALRASELGQSNCRIFGRRRSQLHNQINDRMRPDGHLVAMALSGVGDARPIWSASTR
jgi:hypothetical protein